MLRLIAVPLVLCGVLAAAACGGAGENRPASAPNGPTLEVVEDDRAVDAQDVAARSGIPEEVQRHQQDLGDLISAFEQRVGNQERHRYGGLYIEHEPYYHVVVLLTSGAVSELEVPERLGGLVVIRHVVRTLVELHAMQRRVIGLRSAVGFGSNTNVHLNRVELELIGPTRSDLESAAGAIGDAAAQTGKPLPEWVTLVGFIVPVEETAGERPHFLLTHSPVGSGFGYDAIAGGVLELDLERGCVLLSGHAVIWPAGTTLTRDPPRLLIPGGLTAKPGDTVSGGGGYVPRAGPRQSANGIDGDLEKALDCATEPDVILFWPRGESMTVSRGG